MKGLAVLGYLLALRLLPADANDVNYAPAKRAKNAAVNVRSGEKRLSRPDNMGPLIVGGQDASPYEYPYFGKSKSTHTLSLRHNAQVLKESF